MMKTLKNASTKRIDSQKVFQRVFSMNAGGLMTEEEILDTLKTMNNAHRSNYFIRLADRSYVILKDLVPKHRDIEAPDDAQTMLNESVANKVREEYRDKVYEFVNLSTLTERMASTDVLKIEYQNVADIWVVAAFSAITRENGVVTKVDFRVSELTFDRGEAQELLQMQKEAISTLSDNELIFISIIDRETGASRVIQSENMINTNCIFDLNDAMRKEAMHMYEPDRERFIREVNLSRIRERLAEADSYDITVFVKSQKNGKFRRVTYHFAYNTRFPNYILSTTEDVTGTYVRDNVTGGKNFNGFRMDCVYNFECSNPQEYVLMNYNIVNFKAVNTVYGYESGDWLLNKVLSNLENSEFPFVSVCRENADNFFCLCRKEDYDYDSVNKLCKMNVISDEGLTYRTELFCGVYCINRNETLDASCDKARIARRHAEREVGINTYVLNDKVEQKYLDEAVVIASISEAIKNNEIVVYYQPIYNAQSGQIASAEALVRWRHPEKGLLPPGVFIPAVERSGQITEIDMHVMEQVKKFLRSRLDSGGNAVPVSVNVSRYDFTQDRYMKETLSVAAANPEITDLVRLELTETELINIPSTGKEFIEEMRMLGVKTMIDDFGTGYSSLASVLERPCDFIKLDMSFAQRIGVDEKIEILIRAIIETAHYFDVKVVAEGVETKDQYDFLRERGCDYIQGYYFSKPVSQDEFERLIEA